ncbi:MAG: hypothetical protein JW754_05670 [Candidatus Aenigmarchaeota archaeon]|nr:hypothetical protein [Candidatus Aenigmarchaeota archaeon]
MGCSVCGKRWASLSVCSNTKTVICKDCCIKASKNIVGKCGWWDMCWG